MVSFQYQIKFPSAYQVNKKWSDKEEISNTIEKSICI